MLFSGACKQLSFLNWILKWTILGTVLASLQACSVLPRLTASEETRATVASAESVRVGGVPFFRQSAYYCGPSSLAALFKKAGLSVSPVLLAESISTPDLKGTLRADLTASARQHGLVPIQLDDLQSLLDALRNDLPVLVLVNLSLDIAPLWHYMVVYGYDSRNKQVLVRSGEMVVPAIDVFTFDRLWARAQRWAMVVLRPDSDLPDFVSAQQWLEQSLNLETINPQGFATALSNGADTFVTDGSFDFALANFYLSKNETRKSVTLYERSLKRDPEFAPAWNNLAEAFLFQNKKLEAHHAVSQAIRLGGRFEDEYKKTLKKVERALTATQ